MDGKFVVITEIYFNGEKVSRRRKAKNDLEQHERNQLIKTIYDENIGKFRIMDLYSYICINLKEIYGIILSERTIMRIIESFYPPKRRDN